MGYGLPTATDLSTDYDQQTASRPPAPSAGSLHQWTGPANGSAAERILISDRDAHYGAELAAVLGRNGYAVELFSSAQEAWSRLCEESFDLLIVGSNQPVADSSSFMRHALLMPRRPAVIVLAEVPDEIDHVVALELGAEDYLSKACSARELVARVRALARRWRGAPPTTPSAGDQPRDREPTFAHIRFAGWTIDLDGYRVSDPDGAERPLTRTEFDLLVALARNAGVIIGRAKLLEMTRRGSGGQCLRSIDVHVSRLRGKLRYKDHELIRTVRDRGYLFLGEPAWD